MSETKRETCETCGHEIEDPKLHFRCENFHANVALEGNVIDICYTDDDGEDESEGLALYKQEALDLAKWLVEAVNQLV